jgi:protoporphyrinogen oxidase
VSVVIIGAGVTGLCAGWELLRNGYTDFTILESAPEAGGLSGSVVDPNGFTWDHGGHVVFSHYGEFDRLLLDLMGDEVEHHDRSSLIFHRHGRPWVPYPFQDHPRYLDQAEQLAVLDGLITAANNPGFLEPPSLDLWARATFGDGIYDLFFKPYNEKVWQTSLSKMSSSWVADRVSTPDWRKGLKNIITGQDTDWGPNATFTFPARGGTGEIWRRLAKRLSAHIVYNAKVVVIDPKSKIVATVHKAYRYETVISTIPLDILADIAQVPETEHAKDLHHNSVYVVGIGVETDDAAPADWSWTYYPQPVDEVPFYRVTNFSKYAADNAPDGCTSFMCEVGTDRVADTRSLEDSVWRALVRIGLVAETAELRSRYIHFLPYAYPVPTISRDRILQTVQPVLESHEILSRGRFGAWRYEAGNQDHSAMQGLEVARRVLFSEPETVISADL